MRRILLQFSLAFLVVSLAGCRRDPPAPTDAETGKPAAPRIVSLSPAITIMLHDLGLADYVVGRHAWDRTLPTSTPVVGDQTGIDYEQLARLAPTHILLQQTAGGEPELLKTLAHERGWTSLSMPLLALDDIPRAIDLMANEFAAIPGVPNRAAEIHRRISEAWRPREALAESAGRTLVVYWTSPIGVAGPGSFHHDLLLRMGFRAVPATGSPFITLDFEDVRRLAPESIHILTPDLAEDEARKAIRAWEKLDLPAVQSGRIILWSDPRFLTPSTAMIDFAEELTAKIEAWSESAAPGAPSR